MSTAMSAKDTEESLGTMTISCIVPISVPSSKRSLVKQGPLLCPSMQAAIQDP